MADKKLFELVNFYGREIIVYADSLKGAISAFEKQIDKELEPQVIVCSEDFKRDEIMRMKTVVSIFEVKEKELIIQQ